MELVTVDSVEQAGQLAASLIAARALEGHGTVALPGGRSVATTYEALAAYPAAVLERLHVRIADERTLTDKNEDLIRALLIEPASRRGIAIDFPALAREGPVEKIVASYRDSIVSIGSAFDSVLVSSGEDGHALGLYPGFPQLDSTERVEAFDDSPKPPSERMTTTFACYDPDRTLAIVLFLGEGKRAALGRLLAGADYHELPVAGFAGFEHAVIITDQHV